jgi:hypothetical protein
MIQQQSDAPDMLAATPSNKEPRVVLPFEAGQSNFSTFCTRLLPALPRHMLAKFSFHCPVTTKLWSAVTTE